MQHELAARSASVGGDDRDLDAELVGHLRLAFADALDLGGVKGIELSTALALQASMRGSTSITKFRVDDAT